MSHHDLHKQGRRFISALGGARPMKAHIDSNGNEWLCDAGIDPKEGLAQQGCWRVDEMQFNRND